MIKTILIRGVAVLVGVLLLVLGVFLTEWGFGGVLDFRQLERIPPSRILESLPGEVQVSGRAQVLDRTVRSTHTKTETLYFRYLKEREEKDSDGNTSWRTVDEQTQAVNFLLVDDTGSARVAAESAIHRAKWSVRRMHRSEQGKYRFTEWRIDPGETITLFAWFDRDPEPELSFPFRGAYQPIVTSFGAGSERASIALTAIFKFWGGLTALVLACYAIVYGFRIHRTLVFLLLVSSGGALLLMNYGYRSASQDVAAGHERFRLQSSRAAAEIERLLNPLGVSVLGFDFDLSDTRFDPLSPQQKQQINAWRRHVFQVRHRYLDQIDQFPENFMAHRLGLASPQPVELPPDQLAIARADAGAYQSTRTGTSVWWSVGLLLLTAIGAWISFRVIRIKRMQENIPTSKSAGVVYGLAEVEGELVLDADEPLSGPVSGEPCVWYRYLIEEKRGSGKNQSWHTISDVIRKQPFLCRDDEGEVRVFPALAECISRHREVETRGGRRYTEWRFSPGDELYILGKAKLDRTTGESLVFGHEKGMPFIIANVPEEEVMFRKAMSGLALLGVCVSLLFLGAMLVSGSNGQFSSLDFLLSAMIAPAFGFLVVLILMYNDLVFLRQRCERNWANIQVSLKKRRDLVPQLEQVVRQYLSHEQSLQADLAALRERRNQVDSTADLDAYMQHEFDSIEQINARIESYPDLKGIDLIAVFNRRLIKLENEIALIRAGYNDAVMQYETRRQSFPDNILAGLFGFRARDAIRFTRDAHHVPTVKALTA